jgi:hypothetical protein
MRERRSAFHWTTVTNKSVHLMSYISCFHHSGQERVIRNNNNTVHSDQLKSIFERDNKIFVIENLRIR